MHQDDVQISSPCSADWSAMTGDARRRFCDHCQKHVHDLSAMTEPQAQEVLAQPEVCVRYTPSASGEIRFRPASRRALLRQGVMAAGLLAASLPAVAAMSPDATGASGGPPSLLSWLWSAVFGEPPVQGEIMPVMGAMPIEQDTGLTEEITPEPAPAPAPVEVPAAPTPPRTLMGMRAIPVPPSPPPTEEAGGG